MKLHSPLFTCLLLPCSLFAAETPLKPLMAQPDKVVLKADFESAAPLPRETWSPRQGTRWAVETGMLHGQPSTAEYQASRKDHKGFEPRLSIPACPREYIISFSIRFTGGKPSAIVPFIDIGHHFARLAWAGGGAKLLVDHESTIIAQAPDFKIEDGKWFHGLIEAKGDEIVIQFEGQPVIYGKHASLKGTDHAFGIAGNQGGTADLDNITIWSVKAGDQPGWSEAKSKLAQPTATPAPTKKAPAKKAAAKKK